jgi:hypothetical protein
MWSRIGDEEGTYIASWIWDAVSDSEQKGDADHALEVPGVMWFLQTIFDFCLVEVLLPCFIRSCIHRSSNFGTGLSNSFDKYTWFNPSRCFTSSLLG